MYKGTIVEESLEDNRILNDIKIVGLEISQEEDPTKRWHMYSVEVSDKDIETLSKTIKQGWYMHFWQGNEVIAVFKGKRYAFNHKDKSTWKPVLDYGKSIGIPVEQLDFPIK